ncbi:GPI ethanolamine phosphate transferase 1-like isoform X1 [Limulus polyphemus]|uniref:GPI ethanolamine phosphate transferase 1 n=1 Tax=Limulus polyphemus TaxID=6850 RepID=A0ABM1SMG0_LIMPO|nr:GPI ethanolamine phosphate transferase 1-like isoform X1 [Limulus polyphemus]
MFYGILGLSIHVLFLYSIFDIYFKSPIIHGMKSHSPPVSPARRLVLIVADGLRADKFFEVDSEGHSRSPFLRDIITSKGSWGVSHTRVPTESRPGHVALIAGFYEDVSAVAKGWKENPVEFDSVFNQSRFTWSWGSPDILPMFAKGAVGNHVFTHTYPAELEDFAAKDMAKLDTWVFDQFKEFLLQAKKNSTLMDMVNQDRVIFFLHLLGLDTNGHGHSPGSVEYLENIRTVDKGLKECVDLLSEYFGHDNKTSFIFTSDHGMTDWGSHGMGHPHETLTPIVAWGAGVRGPIGAGRDLYRDGLSEAWKLSIFRRTDVGQADVAPLISILLGISIPVNSIGVLPFEFLGTNARQQALAVETNIKQILEHYHLKVKLKKESTFSIFFRHFRDLTPERERELLEIFNILMNQNRYNDAIQVGIKLMQLALQGLTYYQRYDRFTLNCSILFGFLGWLSYVGILIIRDHTSILHKSLEVQSDKAQESGIGIQNLTIGLFSGAVTIIITFLLYVQNAPTMYYLYFLSPVLLWTLVAVNWNVYKEAKAYVDHHNYVLQLLGLGVLGIFGLELLVISFFRRWMLSLGLVAIAFWPLGTSLKDTDKLLTLTWIGSTLLMAVFPLLPVVGREANYNMVALAGFLNVMITGYCAKRPEVGIAINTSHRKGESNQNALITAAQVVLLIIGSFTIRSTAASIENKEGLPLLNQLVAWIILVILPTLPVFGSPYVLTRLLNVAASLVGTYLLLCVSHEGLFGLCLCILMFLWLCVEHRLSHLHYHLQDVIFLGSISSQQRKSPVQSLTLQDFRRAYFFVFFIFTAFFGTGNIASVNSFEPASVYCFLTVFNPFVMGFLLLIKIMIPFLIVSCAFRGILVTLKIPNKALFLLVLLMSDFMGLHFFFMVTDTGSWLDIGTSISHYVIVMTTTIFVMILNSVASFLTRTTWKLRPPQLKRHLP